MSRVLCMTPEARRHRNDRLHIHPLPNIVTTPAAFLGALGG